jgi:hypothetical protein
MFGSPMSFCPARNDWIALDQSLEECALSHRCSGGECALRALFVASSAEAARGPAESLRTRRQAALPQG